MIVLSHFIILLKVFQKNTRKGRLYWVFFAIFMTWLLITILTFFDVWVIVTGLVLATIIVYLIIFVFLLRNYLYQKAETKRLQRIVEVRADRMNALSHEIRTPLAMVRGATDLIIEGNPGPLTDQQLTFLKTISQNCDHTISLAEDLLTHARIEAGLFKIRLEPVDMIKLFRQVIKDLELTAEARDQKIRVDYPQVMDRAYSDPRLIRQALTNLLHNAFRHTSFGGNIFVSIAENEEGIIISVTDDGAGMSEEERRKLFRKFASGRPLGDGTGLGLVITKQIVELHGGQIMVDTSIGRGTTVLFTLPRWKVEING